MTNGLWKKHDNNTIFKYDVIWSRRCINCSEYVRIIKNANNKFNAIYIRSETHSLFNNNFSSTTKHEGVYNTLAEIIEKYNLNNTGFINNVNDLYELD